MAVERGAGTGIGGKFMSGSAFRKTEEAKGRTRGSRKTPSCPERRCHMRRNVWGANMVTGKNPKPEGNHHPGELAKTQEKIYKKAPRRRSRKNHL